MRSSRTIHQIKHAARSYQAKHPPKGRAIEPGDAISGEVSAELYNKTCQFASFVSAVFEMAKRLIAYIDGFNLYRGMRDAKMDSLLWLDLNALVKRLCPKDTRVAAVKYVTARILNLKQKTHPGFADGEASRKRQTDYIDALISTGVMVFEGKYKLRPVVCRSCGAKWTKPEEKASDVHLATQLLSDAFRGEFDTAMIMSGDADVAPAIRVVVDELHLPVIVAFPPNRVLNELKTISTGFIHINRRHIGKSQFTDEFTHEGHLFKRPAKWSRNP